LATADIVILGVVLLSALIGLGRGILKEVISLATWAAAIGLALVFTPQVAAWLTERIADESLRRVAAFAGIFLATLIAGGLLQALIGALVKGTGLTGTDRLLGFVFGAGRGLLVCLVGLMAMRSFAGTTEWWRESTLIPELLAFEGVLLDVLGKSTEWLSKAGDGG
jgi:membrane protein required for colicin V production